MGASLRGELLNAIVADEEGVSIDTEALLPAHPMERRRELLTGPKDLWRELWLTVDVVYFDL